MLEFSNKLATEEKMLMRIIGILAVLFALWSCSLDRVSTYDLVITNINLIDGTGNELQENMTVAIKQGKIAFLGKKSNLKSKQLIDGTNKYLIPGLFDCHVHTDNYERAFPGFIHYGITSIFITGGSLCTNEYYAAMRREGNQDTIPAPFVFHTSQHFSMEGRHPSKTYSSSNWRDGESIFYLTDTIQIEHLIHEVAQHPVIGIKLTIEDGPVPPFVERMPQSFIDKTVREASKYGLEVFAHVSDNIELEMAIKGGVQNLVHFTGINIEPQDSNQIQLLTKFVKQNPDWVTTLMIDKSFLYPLHPEWFESKSMLAVYKESIKEINPELIERANNYANILMHEYGLNEISLEAIMLPQVEDIKLLNDMGFNMVLGTDTGNNFNFPGYSLHEEMQLLELGGMEPIEIIKMGTLNAAKMMNAHDSLGSIEVGKIANLVLLNKNPLQTIENSLFIDRVVKKGMVQKRLER